jgi:hypothetical protein
MSEVGGGESGGGGRGQRRDFEGWGRSLMVGGAGAVGAWGSGGTGRGWCGDGIGSDQEGGAAKGWDRGDSGETGKRG